MAKITALIARLKVELDDARKALIVAVPAVGLIVGTSNPWYVKALAALTAAGVYGVANKSKAAKAA